jgi:hypothetical protein
MIVLVGGESVDFVDDCLWNRYVESLEEEVQYRGIVPSGTP